MSPVDTWLVLLMIVTAYLGYRRGLVVGVLSFVGFLVGTGLGMFVALQFVRTWVPGPQQTMAAVFTLVLVAGLVQALMAVAAAYLRRRLTWKPARVADAVLGAVLAVSTALVLTWVAALVVRQAPVVPGLSRAVGESSVLAVVDTVVPAPAGKLVSSFRTLLDDSAFPQVFSGVTPERIKPVGSPRPELARAAKVRAAADSIVEITGNAQECRQRVTGSGFVYAPQHVLTNAHVVSGVDEPKVRIGGEGRSYDARVVEYDPARDVAVLYVPELGAESLALNTEGIDRGDDIVVAGFPNGGPYTVGAGRVRDRMPVRGPDIYRDNDVTRQVLSLRAVVDHGSSGGPVLAPDGTVVGLIFAKSVEDRETAYALQLEEFAPVAEAGLVGDGEVDTGDCAS